MSHGGPSLQYAHITQWICKTSSRFCHSTVKLADIPAVMCKQIATRSTPAAVVAQANPAGPAPTTAMRCRFSMGTARDTTNKEARIAESFYAFAYFSIQNIRRRDGVIVSSRVPPGSMDSVVSYPARGLTRHELIFPSKV